MGPRRKVGHLLDPAQERDRRRLVLELGADLVAVAVADTDLVSQEWVVRLGLVERRDKGDGSGRVAERAGPAAQWENVNDLNNRRLSLPGWNR